METSNQVTLFIFSEMLRSDPSKFLNQTYVQQNIIIMRTNRLSLNCFDYKRGYMRLLYLWIFKYSN